MISLRIIARQGPHVIVIDDSGDSPIISSIEKVEEEKPREMPAPTLKGAASFVAQNLGMHREPSATELSIRKGICTRCPDNDLGRCLRCGCYLYSKVRIASEKCPVGKWLAEP